MKTDTEMLGMIAARALCIDQTHPGFIVIRTPCSGLVVEEPVRGPDDYLDALRRCLTRVNEARIWLKVA